jgi:transketolase
MRKQFANLIHSKMATQSNIVVLTADLGYGLWDRIKIDYPDRFIDVGASEQLLIGAAVGLSMEGKIPIAYSITSFLLYRGFEFIRNYIHHEKWPVVLAGGGRDKDYGYLGYSHWAEEDIEVLTNLRNINLYKPVDEQAMYQDVNTILEKKAPCYINLSK